MRLRTNYNLYISRAPTHRPPRDPRRPGPVNVTMRLDDESERVLPITFRVAGLQLRWGGASSWGARGCVARCSRIRSHPGFTAVMSQGWGFHVNSPRPHLIDDRLPASDSAISCASRHWTAMRGGRHCGRHSSWPEANGVNKRPRLATLCLTGEARKYGGNVVL